MLRLIGLAAILVLTAAAPAAADWLVTTSGEEIETAGEWEVRGALVVFQTPDGRLNSLRASEVDLDASHERTTAPVVEPEPEPEPTPRGPVLVITDADVAHVAADFEETGEPEAEDGPEAEDSPAASVLEVVRWQDLVDVQANTLQIFGSVANRGESVVTNARVMVRLLDRSGDLLESQRATLGEPAIGPGAMTSFSATFPGSPGFASVEFDVQARGFRVRPAPELLEAPDGSENG